MSIIFSRLDCFCSFPSNQSPGKLDDEARLEVTKIVEAKLALHTDPKRAKDVENIKGW